MSQKFTPLKFTPLPKDQKEHENNYFQLLDQKNNLEAMNNALQARNNELREETNDYMRRVDENVQRLKELIWPAGGNTLETSPNNWEWQKLVRAFTAASSTIKQKLQSGDQTKS